MRTGAATAVAARYLANQKSTTATIIGCGIQGRIQLRSLAEVLPLETVYAFDLDQAQSQMFANDMRQQTGLDVVAIGDFADGTRVSQVVVTCTSSRDGFLGSEHIAPGTFISAVGADNDDKQELRSDLVLESRLVTDVTDQCAVIGELRHVLQTGSTKESVVWAELGAIAAGAVTPTISDTEIVIFDSTGSAIQDVAAAGIIYERAIAANAGIAVEMAQ